MANKYKIFDYIPFIYNIVEQGSLTVNSLFLNFLVFLIYATGSYQLNQAITITIILSTTSTLVNALSTWRILDHKELGKVDILVIELILIAVVCFGAGMVFSYFLPFTGVGWFGLGSLFLTASMYYFLRDVLVYLKSISALIIINLFTLIPLVLIFYKYMAEGGDFPDVWSLFQWGFLFPRFIALLVLIFIMVKVREKFTVSFGEFNVAGQPLLRALASIAVAARVHAPYFLLNAVGLTLFAELFRKFFIILAPVSQVLQANYAFFLPRKNKMHMLIPSLLLSSLIGMLGVFILRLFFLHEEGGIMLYVFIVIVSFLMSFRAYYFILNRVGREYFRELSLSFLVVMFSALYIYNLTPDAPNYYVGYLFLINEIIYLIFTSLFNARKIGQAG